jgi:hypothetical protein
MGFMDGSSRPVCGQDERTARSEERAKKREERYWYHKQQVTKILESARLEQNTKRYA